MEISFLTTVWKYALLTVNILISLLCMAYMSFGVVTLGGAGSVTGAYIATALGFLIFSLSFLGCFAALRESYILSLIFVGTAIGTIVLQTIFMITFAIFKSELMEMATVRVAKIWEQEQEKPGAMNVVHVQYGCCGMDSPQDFLLDDDDELPTSCFYGGDCSNKINMFTAGCRIRSRDFLEDQSDYLILSTVGLVGLEVLGMIAAYFLSKGVETRIQKPDQIIITE